MPKVLDINGDSIKVEDELYRDFFYEVLILDSPQTVMTYLTALTLESREALCGYIVNRLAEVDPGYVGNPPLAT